MPAVRRWPESCCSVDREGVYIVYHKEGRCYISSFGIAPPYPSRRGYAYILLSLRGQDLDRDVSGTVRAGLEGLPAYVLEGQFKVSRMQEIDKQILRVISCERPLPTVYFKTRRQSR